MKGLKYITGCSLTLLLLAACNKEEGPSIDDYFLNYEIPEIPVTEDYQVGIFYNKNGDLAQTPNGEPNFTRWELLTKLDSELDQLQQPDSTDHARVATGRFTRSKR